MKRKVVTYTNKSASELTLNTMEILLDKCEDFILTVHPKNQYNARVTCDYIVNNIITSQYGGDDRKYFDDINLLKNRMGITLRIDNTIDEDTINILYL